MSNEYSVCEFFADDTHAYASRFVSMQQAVEQAMQLTRNVGARIGATTRIIVTDGGDDTVLEWQYGKGITWPTAEDLARMGFT